MTTRMPRYDIRNDGVGPYAVFYCDKCNREFRSSPDIGGTIATDIGRSAVGGLLRGVPILGSAASRATEEQRYSTNMTPQQLEAAWKQVEPNFHECPTCRMVVCPSDWDAQGGYCNDDTPRRDEIAQAKAEQAAGMLKGLAGAFGLGEVVRSAAQAAQTASASLARCPKDGTTAPAGTKFCPNCGSPMTQPQADACPQCGTDVKGAKFCPNCGTKIERAAPAPAFCPHCGAKSEGAKFCPNCGAKLA